MQGGMACLSFPALTMGSLLLFLEALLKSLVYYKQVFPLPQPLHSHSVHILPQLKSGSLLLIRIQLLGGKISQGRGGSFSHILTNTLGPRAVLGISFLFFTTTLHHEKGGSWTPPPVTAFPDGKTPLPPLLSFLPADPRSLKHQPLTSICVSISSSPSSYWFQSLVLKHLASASKSLLSSISFLLHSCSLFCGPALDLRIIDTIYNHLSSQPWTYSFFSPHSFDSAMEVPWVGAESPSSEVQHAQLGHWSLADFPGLASSSCHYLSHCSFLKPSTMITWPWHCCIKIHSMVPHSLQGKMQTSCPTGPCCRI